MRARPAAWTVIAAICLALPLAAAAQQQPPAKGARTGGEQIKIPDGSKWGVEQAIANLRSSDKGTRMAALRRLAGEPGPTIQKWIAEAAQYDPEARIRYEAVLILGKRKESASLPILMHIAETDKDDRVRTAARSVAGIRPKPVVAPGAPAQPASQPAPGQPQPAPGPAAQPAQQPPAAAGQPAPAPEPDKVYDEDGNELPPGYLDGQTGASDADFDSPLGAGLDLDEEKVVDTSDDKRLHSGFLPTHGYDGAMGTPRNTATVTAVALQLGLGGGKFQRDVHENVLYDLDDDLDGLNDFSSLDFSLLLAGRFSPWDFLEIGLDVEVLTVEKLDHTRQTWRRDGDAEDPEDWENEETERNSLFNDASYSGAAFGQLSLDLKAIVLDLDMVKAGIVVRATFPTHTGKRFEEGIGATDLFLPTRSAEADFRYANYTVDGTMWGVEPGIVASVAPINGLTVYTDITFMATILTYSRRWEFVLDNQAEQDREELEMNNYYLIPHVGAQYRLLNDSLGFQLALSPAIYLGQATGSGLASFGIVPGAFYRVADLIDLTLTVSIEAGANAPLPFVCTDLQSFDGQESPTTGCGVGRRAGFALQAAYTF